MKSDISQHRDAFRMVAMTPEHPNWAQAISRQTPSPLKEDEIRSEFDRDNGRILHSLAYSRLKSKTQVFFHTNNDSICTRIEHVNHVISVSNTIARFLGLNSELTYAIAMGHDLGHAPFGHSGEVFLDNLCKDKGLGEFWHEKNSLRVVDSLELLQDSQGKFKNLNLTYAVRDGIVSHCGEVNQERLFPRQEAIDLESFTKYNRFEPYTWEGCVMKISDKIAYLGRDLEDAQRLHILDKDQLDELHHILLGFPQVEAANNTNFIHVFITDLCRNSSPETGLCFSPEVYTLMKTLMRFNYKHIYKHPRLENYEAYAQLVINTVYGALESAYQGKDTLDYLSHHFCITYPRLGKTFLGWLSVLVKENRNNLSFTEYSDRILLPGSHTTHGFMAPGSQHKRLYNLEEEKDYYRAIIDFISLLTDRAAIDFFDELTSF